MPIASAMAGVHRDRLVLASKAQWPKMYSVLYLKVKTFLLILCY